MYHILMVGHASDPQRGSEHASTWNWAWYVALRAHVTLITHESNRAGTEAFLKLHPNPNLRIIWVGLNPATDPWRPGKSDRGIHIHYLLWQRKAFAVARRLLTKEHFDLVHHVGWGSLSAPPPMWKLGRPFVWGPVGGGQTAPAGFGRYFGPAAFLENLRTWRVKLMPRLASVRAAARHSALILATNDETAEALIAAGASRVNRFLDSGVAPESLAAAVEPRPAHAELRLLWAGRMERRKALPLVLEAVAARPDVPIHLTVSGAGPMLDSWKRLAADLGLGNRVEFIGWTPWNQMGDVYARADAFVFSSLRDSFAAVNLEAMAQGLPLIALNHQGVGTFMPENAGIKVPVNNPEQCVRDLGEAFATVYANPLKRVEWGQAGLEFARSQRWDARADGILEIYSQIAQQTRKSPEQEALQRRAEVC